MKIMLMILLASPLSWSQNLSPEEQRLLLQEVKTLKERVNKLEQKESGGGFKSTDYGSKTTDSAAAPSAAQGPAMTDEQKKEIMDTLEKYKKAQADQEKYLKELEDEE